LLVQLGKLFFPADEAAVAAERDEKELAHGVLFTLGYYTGKRALSITLTSGQTLGSAPTGLFLICALQAIPGTTVFFQTAVILHP
jgi:hypothetical protein